jgi:hypothetical protein
MRVCSASRPAPAFLHHVKNIPLSNVEISARREDRRPAFVLQDVQRTDFFPIRASQAKDVPTFALKNVGDFNV